MPFDGFGKVLRYSVQGDVEVNSRKIQELVESCAKLDDKQLFEIVNEAWGDTFQIRHFCTRAQAQSAITKGLVRIGRLDWAREKASEIKSSYWQAEALIAITWASKDMKDYKQLREAALGINSSCLRTEIQREIESLQAEIMK